MLSLVAGLESPFFFLPGHPPMAEQIGISVFFDFLFSLGNAGLNDLFLCSVRVAELEEIRELLPSPFACFDPPLSLPAKHYLFRSVGKSVPKCWSF